MRRGGWKGCTLITKIRAVVCCSVVSGLFHDSSATKILMSAGTRMLTAETMSVGASVRTVAGTDSIPLRYSSRDLPPDGESTSTMAAAPPTREE